MVLKLNKYLREIGINEKYWLFDKDNQGDPRYIPDEEGFIDAEHFSLDTSLSLYIYSQLCYFRDWPAQFSCPMGMTKEQWLKIIDKMIEAFKLMIIDEDTSENWILTKKEKHIKSKNREKKINYGMRLFIKYYRHLWY